MADEFALTIEPRAATACDAAKTWPHSESVLFGRSLREWQRETRTVLGIPRDALVVLTGHQAQVWHAGILAKWFLAEACAARLGGAAVQLVVDQDINDPAFVQYPSEHEGELVVAHLPLSPPRREGPSGLQPTAIPGAPTMPPLPEARAGVERITAALATAANSADGAAQVVNANGALLGPWLKPFPAVFATTMLATPLGAALVDAMRREPDRVAHAYDTALASDPHSARALDPARRELPLWRLVAGQGVRERVCVDGNGRLPGVLLAPRAFLMTAFARLALADLFVHGTGAQRYERITEAWIREWLGLELAPSIVTTATLRLPLERFVERAPLATIADLRRLRWDPDAEGATPSGTKREWLERIGRAPRRSPERRTSYRGMLAYLESRRTARAPQLARIAELVDSSRARARTKEIALSRTWPWPLHEPERIGRLQARVRESVR